MLLALSISALVGAQADLSPLFELDPSRLRAAYAAGRSAASKKTKIEALVRPWCQDVGRVRSPKGLSFTAPYVALVLPVVSSMVDGFNAQREYRDDKQHEKLLAELQSNPPQPKDRRIRLIADLYAWPGISDWNHSINRSASQADVKDVKFVLLIDGLKPVHPVVRPTALSEAVMDGSVSIPEYHTIHGASTTTSRAVATGSDGSSATATGTSNTSSTVTYVTHAIQGFSAYQATYSLEFPLYDESGVPLVSRSTKKLVLKVIRPDGEHTGVFDLEKYNKLYWSLVGVK